ARVQVEGLKVIPFCKNAALHVMGSLSASVACTCTVVGSPCLALMATTVVVSATVWVPTCRIRGGVLMFLRAAQSCGPVAPGILGSLPNRATRVPSGESFG